MKVIFPSGYTCSLNLFWWERLFLWCFPTKVVIDSPVVLYVKSVFGTLYVVKEEALSEEGKEPK